MTKVVFRSSGCHQTILNINEDEYFLKDAFQTHESVLLKYFRDYVKEYYVEHKHEISGLDEIKSLKKEIRKCRRYIEFLEHDWDTDVTSESEAACQCLSLLFGNMTDTKEKAIALLSKLS